MRSQRIKRRENCCIITFAYHYSMFILIDRTDIFILMLWCFVFSADTGNSAYATGMHADHATPAQSAYQQSQTAVHYGPYGTRSQTTVRNILALV